MSDLGWPANDVRRAVNASCTCGGDGPGNCCPACEVWHALKGRTVRGQAPTRAELAETLRLVLASACGNDFLCREYLGPDVDSWEDECSCCGDKTKAACGCYQAVSLARSQIQAAGIALVGGTFEREEG